jgi:uncharacterized membrane protein YdjX (TVP38/TMEM64 family)
VAAGLALAAVVLLLAFAGHEAAEALPEFAAWVRGLGAWGPLAFIAGYCVAALILIPGLWLTLAAGAIFGAWWAVLWVMIGATAGASLAFLASRHVARGLVERLLGRDPRLAAIDHAIGESGTKLVLLLRLAPVIPFNVLNYALGLTRVRLGDFVAGSIGMLPATVLWAYTGHVAGDLAALASGATPAPRGPGYYVVLAIGLAAIVGVLTIATRMARAALREVLD